MTLPPSASAPEASAGPRVLTSYGSTEHLRVTLLSDKPGKVEFGGSAKAVVCVHVGPSVEMWCQRGGETHHGTAIHGDIDIIPPHTSGTWELRGRDTALSIAINFELLKKMAADLGRNPERLLLRNRFQVRDAQLEHLAWAVKEEMERGYPSGPLYLEGIAMALAARLVRDHSSFTFGFSPLRGQMAPRRLKAVLSYIEDRLNQSICLDEVAQIAGLSLSHFKVQFRRSVGMPAHRYVIQRRVERAAWLLRTSDLAISQVALEAGFAHQSHLAVHMRRLLGLSPREVRNNAH